MLLMCRYHDLKMSQGCDVVDLSIIAKGKLNMARFLSTLKYTRYAMGSLTAVLFSACVGGS